MAQVGVGVEREAVQAHPAPQVDADRADLAPVRPHAVQAVAAARLDSQPRQVVDAGLFEQRDEARHGEITLLQGDDGVAHDLPWPVVGGAAAALDLGHVETEPPQPLAVDEQVAGGGPPTQGDRRRMFEEEERVVDASLDAAAADGALQDERFVVPDQSQVADAQPSRHAITGPRTGPRASPRRLVWTP